MNKAMKKEKGWPRCDLCQLWKPITCECRAENAEGLCPCEVMSKKQFDYLCKQAEGD